MTCTVQYEPVDCKTVLNPVKAPSMPFEWSINPYRGCRHGCSFCYARSTHAYLGIEADDTFQNRILIKANAPETLMAQLARMSRSGKLRKIGQVAIGTATDPYQQVEGKARITRQCLELLALYRVPVSITTRSPLILRDLDILKQSAVVSVNISINTLDTEVWRSLEPFTPSPARRLETVGKLVEEGIPAGIFMAPIMPYLTDDPESLERLIACAARVKTRFVMASVLRLSTREVRNWFFQTLRSRYPSLVGRYAALYDGSAYAPPQYRDPVKRTIGRLLDRYGLSGMDAYVTSRTTAASGTDASRDPENADLPAVPARQESDEPIQLAFDFGAPV